MTQVGLTLLYFLMFLTSSMKASSTLTLCFADVSMQVVPKCLASSRPSGERKMKRDETRQSGPSTRFELLACGLRPKHSTLF